MTDISLAAPVLSESDIADLVHRIAGVVLLPGQAGYAEECRTYNTALPNTPALVVGAAGPEDVRAALAFARTHDLAVAVMNTGHTTVVPHPRTLLLTTRRMNEVTVDRHARRARVGAGVLWQQVVDAAAEHGLAPLNGSSPLVGVVGYTLGGGLSATLGRKFGWAGDHVTSMEIVTADGRSHRVDAGTEPELFWAARGAKSNVGIVTALEFELFDVPRLHAGALVYPGEHAAAVLSRYAELTAIAPDELTTSIAFMRLPDVPVFPEPLRGRFTVHVRVSWLGDAATADALLEPLRTAAPLIVDTVVDRPYRDFAAIYNDPVEPAPFAERTAALAPLDAGLVDRVLAEIGPQRDVPANIIELRHLGGALRAEPASAGAAGLRNAEFVLWVVTVGDPTTTTAAGRWTDGFLAALEPWTLAGKHLNFLAHDDLDAQAVREAYPAAVFERLQRAKATYDPENVFRLNHNIEPAG